MFQNVTDSRDRISIQLGPLVEHSIVHTHPGGESSLAIFLGDDHNGGTPRALRRSDDSCFQQLDNFFSHPLLVMGSQSIRSLLHWLVISSVDGVLVSSAGSFDFVETDSKDFLISSHDLVDFFLLVGLELRP